MCDHCGCEDHIHEEGHDHDHHHHEGSARTIRIEQDVLAHNRSHADGLRGRLASMDARLVNFVGSPGCGKTALLTSLIPLLGNEHPCVVVEGDLATDNDARRIQGTGAPVHQIQTGTACHLTAHDVEHALLHLPLERGGLALVENVGNLVCPSMFDLGESCRAVCLSVTEGADKPEKYPVAFREAHLAVITKADLLPHVDFDLDACLALIEAIKPGLPTVVTSAKDGKSLSKLVAFFLAMWNR